MDAAIKVTYHPQSQKRKEKGGSAFYVGSQKKSVTSYQQTISIRNTRLTSLPTLLVREQVYVSQDERIKVLDSFGLELLKHSHKVVFEFEVLFRTNSWT